MSNFHLLEIVGRYSETQLKHVKVAKKFNYLTGVNRMSGFCSRRRLPVFMKRIQMAEQLKAAVTFVEHGRIFLLHEYFKTKIRRNS